MMDEKYFLDSESVLNFSGTPEPEISESDINQVDTLKEMGRNILDIRQFSGLSQKDFALKLGVSKATVSLWENGKKYPSRKNMEKLSAIFSLEPKDIFSSNVLDKLNNQHQFKFRASNFQIKPGIELHAETEKLSRKDFDNLDKAVKLLKIFFS